MLQKWRTRGHMGQWLRLHTALAEYPSTCNSRSRRPNILFWPPRAPALMWHMYKHTYIHAHVHNTHTQGHVYSLLLIAEYYSILGCVTQLGKAPTHLRTHRLFPAWGYHESNCDKHLSVGFCVSISYHYSGRRAQEHNC